jgi:hypothetical protein
LKLCEGQSVTLISSSAPSYNWSNDDLNQSILVNEAGTYFVSIDGECTEPLTSASVEVEVFETPAAPTVEGVSIDAGETATLDGGMENLQWFSDATTSDLLYEGNPFTTPVLNEDQSYWAASILNHGLETAVGGASDPSTEGQFQESTYYYLTFDAYQDIVIRSAKVIADGAGERTVVVQDPEGAVLDEVTVMIPDGESIVELNLEVEAGTDYGLRVTTTPNLWRDGLESELNYPYEIGTLASVTGTSVGNPQTTLSYYYFFYDITVETQAVACLSDAVEVVVSVVVSVDHLEGIAGLEVYPNPSRGEFTLRLPATAGKLQAEVLSNDGRSVWSKNYASAAEMTRLDLSGLAPGAYVLRLVQGNRVATAHVVIR